MLSGFIQNIWVWKLLYLGVCCHHPRIDTVAIPDIPERIGKKSEHRNQSNVRRIITDLLCRDVADFKGSFKIKVCLYKLKSKF
jgi:hypothetical protein